MTRVGVDRVLRYAFELAADPAGAAPHLGHEEQRHLDLDALLGRAGGGDGRGLPRRPRRPVRTSTSSPPTSCSSPTRFDVVVASNLFGDILSDLGPACTGTIGIAPSANINPTRELPEPVRAGPRLRARHRRAGHRQPDRPDLVRLDDARPPRSPRGGGRRARARSRPCSREGPDCAPLTPDLGGHRHAPSSSGPRSPTTYEEQPDGRRDSPTGGCTPSVPQQARTGCACWCSRRPTAPAPACGPR